MTDRELAQLVTRRLRGARAFQLFLRKLGPRDSVYGSALAWDQHSNVVEARASAEGLEETLVQLFANLDAAADPEER